MNSLDQIDLNTENLDVLHISDILQPLDVGIFGPMKRFTSNCRIDQTTSRQTKQLSKMQKSLFQACCPSSCKAVLENTTILSNTGEEIVYLDYCQMKNVRHFEIVCIDQLL